MSRTACWIAAPVGLLPPVEQITGLRRPDTVLERGNGHSGTVSDNMVLTSHRRTTGQTPALPRYLLNHRRALSVRDQDRRMVPANRAGRSA